MEIGFSRKSTAPSLRPVTICCCVLFSPIRTSGTSAIFGRNDDLAEADTTLVCTGHTTAHASAMAVLMRLKCDPTGRRLLGLRALLATWPLARATRTKAQPGECYGPCGLQEGMQRAGPDPCVTLGVATARRTCHRMTSMRPSTDCKAISASASFSHPCTAGRAGGEFATRRAEGTELAAGRTSSRTFIVALLQLRDGQGQITGVLVND